MSDHLSDYESEVWPVKASLNHPESDEDLEMIDGASIDDPEIYYSDESDSTKDSNNGTNDSQTSNETSDNRTEDEIDADRVIKMFGSDKMEIRADDCCSRGCNSKIPCAVALRYRQSIQEMIKPEKDLVILTHLQLHCEAAEVDKEVYAAERDRGRIRSSNTNLQINYYFAGIPICQKMFLFLHDCGERMYTNLKKHFKKNGLTPRTHGNANKTPNRKNIVTPTEIETVVQFIKGYGEHFGFQLPGRLPKWKNFDVVRLPPDVTKESVYKKFCSTIDIRRIHRTTFLKIWKKYCPYVVITKPANDLCDQCRLHHLAILKSSNTSVKEKLESLKTHEVHLLQAQKQRQFYNYWREKAIDLHKKLGPALNGSKRQPFAVLSFDFAENMKYPRSPLQVGSSYFKSLRVCAVSGIHDEGSRVQHNFLIDEADSIGKGANAVISMLHFYLSQINCDHLVLFADNCVGQNKNNAVLQYLQWRVDTGLNKTVSYNFLVAGHTKFGPDRNFGIVKKRYRTAFIDCLDDLLTCVTESSPAGLNIAVNAKAVRWSDWTGFLKPFFKTFPGLTKYHHFEFKKDSPIKVKEFCDSETEEFSLAKSSMEATEAARLREDIIPEPMTVARQWYLFQNIRELVDDENKKDLVAPEPSTPKPKHSNPTDGYSSVFKKLSQSELKKMLKAHTSNEASKQESKANVGKKRKK